jgi:uncharacterized membrane protein HdeD (DUF308 family)
MLASAARQWWVLVVQGVLGIAFGILALLLPGITLLTVAYLFAAWALISGVSTIGQGWRVAEHRGRSWPFALSGAVSIVAGLLAALVPGWTVAGLILLLGSWLVVAGVMEAYAAWEIRREISNEWILAAAGIVRAIVGLVILAMPIVGAVLSVAFIGSSAILAGIVAIALGLRLRTVSDSLPGGHAASAAG